MLDLDDFWTEPDSFTGPPLTDAMVRDAEALLGYRLPDAYVRLLRSQNGGYPRRNCFPLAARTSQFVDDLPLAGLHGIGGEWGIDSPTLGTLPMIREWDYPAIGIVVADTAAGGHCAIMLDYSACGPVGEPRVVCVEIWRGSPHVFALADNFQAFLDGLVDSGRYDIGDDGV